jgi:hypothetical protein
MSVPQVSVVMAVCNVERFLAESIESVLEQTFTEFEFIIVDFGSTDNSKALASVYAAKDSRIKLHEIPSCVLPVARNAACALARGQYLAVMDADDVCLPDRLRWEVEFMMQHPEIALLGGATEWIDSVGRPLGVQDVPCEDQQIRMTLISRCPFWHPTLLVRREAFVRIGGYREAFVFAHDYDMELRVAEHFGCANLKQVVLRYRIHPSQVTFRKQNLQTLCKLAAQVSAASRREHKEDPLDAVSEITPALLTALGVSEAAQQNALVSDCRNWIRAMSAASEPAKSLAAALEVLGSKLPYVERWQIADLQLTVALLYWQQERFAKSFVSVMQALAIRPAIIGRPFRRLVGRFRRLSAGDTNGSIPGPS